MNIRKSICIALIDVDKNQTWLAETIGVQRQMVSRWITTNKASTSNLELMAGAFDLKASEFIALGE